MFIEIFTPGEAFTVRASETVEHFFLFCLISIKLLIDAMNISRYAVEIICQRRMFLSSLNIAYRFFKWKSKSHKEKPNC